MPAPNPIIMNPAQNLTGFTKASGHGHSIRDKRQGSPYNYPKPDYLYMIYLGFDKDGNLVVRQLVDKITTAKPLDELEKTLFQYARDDRYVEANSFNGLVWDYPCYITMAIHRKDWLFYWRDNPNHDPIIFLAAKQPHGFPKPNLYNPNYAFYDAEHRKIKDIPAAEHDAIRFINYVRDENGPLKKATDVRLYCFEIYLEAPFENPLSPVKRIITLLDPDGQNQGPP